MTLQKMCIKLPSFMHPLSLARDKGLGLFREIHGNHRMHLAPSNKPAMHNYHSMIQPKKDSA